MGKRPIFYVEVYVNTASINILFYDVVRVVNWGVLMYLYWLNVVLNIYVVWAAVKVIRLAIFLMHIMCQKLILRHFNV